MPTTTTISQLHPFADHGALLDRRPRCHGTLPRHAGQLGETKDSPAVAAAIAYLLRTQMTDGSW